MSDKIYDVPSDWQKRASSTTPSIRRCTRHRSPTRTSSGASTAKRINWIKPFTKVKNTSFAPGNISIKWFEDGKLNACFNCVDRHVEKRGDQVALIWEGDDPKNDKTITYKQLHAEVQKFANVLKKQAASRKATASPSICR